MTAEPTAPAEIPPGPVAVYGEQGINPHAERCWFFYEALGALPPGAAAWKQAVDLLLGRRCWPLYGGITGRRWMIHGGRWTEHYAGSARYGKPPKAWAPRVVVWRRHRRRFATEEAAEKFEARRIRYPENTAHNGGNRESPRRRGAGAAGRRVRAWQYAATVATVVWLVTAVLGYRLATGEVLHTWPQWRGALAWSGGALVLLRIALGWQSRV